MKSASAGFALAVTVALAACSHAQDGAGAQVRDSGGGKLGAPIYPGAHRNDQGTFTSVNARERHVIAGFTTAEPFDKVYAFYKAQLPPGSERLTIDKSNGSVANFRFVDAGAANVVTVYVTQSKPGETNILIARVSRKE